MTWTNDQHDSARGRTFINARTGRFDSGKWIDRVCNDVCANTGISRQDANYHLAPDLEYLLTEVFRIPYPDNQAEQLVPVKPVTDGAAELRYRSLDMTGQAKWMGSQAEDIPIADVTKSEASIGLDTIAMQFSYTIDELAASAMAQSNLDMDRAIACRTLIERGADEALCVGQTARSIYGLLNQDLASDDAEIITLTTGTWTGTTSLLIHADMAQLINQIAIDTKGTLRATHVGLPTTVWNLLNVKPWGTDNNSLTVMTVLRQNFPGVTFFWWPRLDTADAAGTGGRVICFSDGSAQGLPNFFTGVARGLTPEAPQLRGLRYFIPMHKRMVPGVAVTNALAIKYADNAQ